MSNLLSEKSLHKLPRKRSLALGRGEAPYCLRSFKRHKVSAGRQFPTNCGAIASQVRGTCTAGVTIVEIANENSKAGPIKLPVEMLPNELKSESMKPPVLHGKAPSETVEMGLLRVLEKVELHNAGNNSFIPKHIDILCSSDTSSRPCAHPRKYPPPKIRKGVTISRDFPQGCGRRNLDLSSKVDVFPDGKSSEEKQMTFQADNESVDLAHSDGDKSATQQGVKTSNCAAAAAATGAIDRWIDKIYELMGHKGFYYLLLKHDDTKSNDGKSASQQGVKTSVSAAEIGATDGCSDKIYELMGHKGSYYLPLKGDDTKLNYGKSATKQGVKISDCEVATGATDGFSDKMYELMGHKGSYYLLLKDEDTKFNVPDVEADIHDMEAVSDGKPNGTLSGKQSENLTVNDYRETLSRSKVRKVLNLFHTVLKKRLLEKQVTRNSKGKKKTISSHICVEVAMLLKQQKEWIYMKERVLGAIPGVEVGDQFHYRAELVIVGVHVQFVAGIDYMEKDGKKIATSIVSLCRSCDEEFTDVLIYFCEGGNQTMADQNSKYQTFVGGNLALKNSMDERTAVRVIRGRQFSEGKSTTFTYDGLYIVSKFWQERVQNGKEVYMFQLNKMQGQPKLKLNKLGRFGKSKGHYYRTLIDDISYGKEKISIPVVNDIGNDKPPTFNYITKMVYPQLRKSVKARGCRCIDGCSDHVQCSCVVKNGGTVPFNEDGALVEAKPIVHECGPSCKCPPSCKNRVSQHGIKFQLEVFKTETRGWGVRSRNFIPSGSFICEYVGELLDDKQAEERIGFDEYLFDIGDEDGFAIDAAHIGNVGRFVNHSCTPNLYAQDVLFDHDDKMMPHVMLFATRNLHPLQEFTYDYNYKIDHVYDANGNVKKKTCHCGARKCTGRMY